MRGSGIRELLATIYASNAVKHMMSGHAYARALRGHFLTSAALTKLMLDTSPGCMADVSVNRFLDMHNDLLQGLCGGDALQKKKTGAGKQLFEILQGLVQKLSSQSRTAKLWINHYSQIQMMRLFLYAERTGDWYLHLYCVAYMIPIFHAWGHLAYAKSARRYLDCMKGLPEIMSAKQFQDITAREAS